MLATLVPPQGPSAARFGLSRQCDLTRCTFTHVHIRAAQRRPPPNRGCTLALDNECLPIQPIQPGERRAPPPRTGGGAFALSSSWWLHAEENSPVQLPTPGLIVTWTRSGSPAWYTHVYGAPSPSPEAGPACGEGIRTAGPCRHPGAPRQDRPAIAAVGADRACRARDSRAGLDLPATGTTAPRRPHQRRGTRRCQRWRHPASREPRLQRACRPRSTARHGESRSRSHRDTHHRPRRGPAQDSQGLTTAHCVYVRRAHVRVEVGWAWAACFPRYLPSQPACCGTAWPPGTRSWFRGRIAAARATSWRRAA